MTTPAAVRVFCVAIACMFMADVATAAPSPRELRIFVASGAPAERTSAYLERLDRLAAELEPRLPPADDAARAAAIHAFLHQRILLGSYEPSASDLGVALDGGPFNCVSATVLYTLLAVRCGVAASPMAVPGHVWCRVDGSPAIDIESTSRDWFTIRTKYQGISTDRVSEAMARHRRRIATGQQLDDRRLLAVLHYNRGVSLIHGNKLPAAAWENLQALALDPGCRPARENLVAVARQIPAENRATNLADSLIYWAIARVQ